MFNDDYAFTVSSALGFRTLCLAPYFLPRNIVSFLIIFVSRFCIDNFGGLCLKVYCHFLDTEEKIVLSLLELCFADYRLKFSLLSPAFVWYILSLFLNLELSFRTELTRIADPQLSKRIIKGLFIVVIIFMKSLKLSYFLLEQLDFYNLLYFTLSTFVRCGGHPSIDEDRPPWYSKYRIRTFLFPFRWLL